MQNALFIISGPSGVGKGTLVKLIMEEDPSLALSVSCTTRLPRTGERDGTEYFFVSKEEFLSRVGENGFLEYDEHFGNYYGTPKNFVLERLKEKSVILEIDVKGALQAKRALAGTATPVVLVMIVPPDIKALECRLSCRGSENEEERKKRMERVRYELPRQGEYDYTVVNDDLQEAKRRLQEIIEQERNKERSKI